MTLFFSSEFKECKRSNEYNITKINLKDKNFFITYYLDNPVYN